MVINFKLTKNIIFCFKEMTTCADNNVDFSDLLPQEVFSFASRDQLKKCKSILENTKEGDPVLVISPNQAWINQHNFPLYTAAMNTFATFVAYMSIVMFVHDDYTTCLKIIKLINCITHVMIILGPCRNNAFFFE